jgi:signal transduction histidine kinase
VKAFVELSGGTVSVASSPEGSRFVLSLPMAKDIEKSA